MDHGDDIKIGFKLGNITSGRKTEGLESCPSRFNMYMTICSLSLKLETKATISGAI